MIDICQFLKPFSETCFRTEKCLLAVTESLAQKTTVRFIPIMPNDAITELVSLLTDVPLPETLSDICHVALDYKSAQLSGNKKARYFLMALQQALITNQQPYSRDLIIDIATQVQLNVADFIRNRDTKETIQAVIQEQQLAQQLMTHVQPGITIDFSTTAQMTILSDCSARHLVSEFTPHLQKHVTPASLLKNLNAYAH